MSYIRDGYVFVSRSTKAGRVGYGHAGRCIFLIGRTKRAISLRNVLFPQKYWDKRIRLKVEVIDDDTGMPDCEEKEYSKADMEKIKMKAYQDGYRKGKQMLDWLTSK